MPLGPNVGAGFSRRGDRQVASSRSRTVVRPRWRKPTPTCWANLNQLYSPAYPFWEKPVNQSSLFKRLASFVNIFRFGPAVA